MNLSRIIIVCNVLVCFVLNNLLFTYSTIKEEKVEVVCMAEDDGCCSEETNEEMCCNKENCCANIPVQSAHLNFSVIIGADEKNDAIVSSGSFNTFQLNNLRSAAELCEGHLHSLIKPPSIA
ncbi:MAG: hypothetical protein KBG47_01025 [Bacteroidia bacterium]|nr:hypothetical protein [Bacteroidia bacterium]